jgi:hypothetical protein
MVDGFAEGFLSQLRDVTNERWRTTTPATFESGFHGVDWQRGTRWRGGMTDSEIAAAEAQFGSEAAAGLRDALIEANLPYLPRFVATTRARAAAGGGVP